MERSGGKSADKQLSSYSAQFGYWVDQALQENEGQPITMTQLGTFLKRRCPDWRSYFSPDGASLTELCYSVLLHDYAGFSISRPAEQKEEDSVISLAELCMGKSPSTGDPSPTTRTMPTAHPADNRKTEHADLSAANRFRDLVKLHLDNSGRLSLQNFEGKLASQWPSWQQDLKVSKLTHAIKRYFFTFKEDGTPLYSIEQYLVYNGTEIASKLKPSHPPLPFSRIYYLPNLFFFGRKSFRRGKS